MPKDFPKWKTVYSFYRRACLNGIWDKIQKALVKKVRLAKGKKETPSYALIDSQSAKTVSSNEKRGYDGGKNERKKKTHSNRYNGKSALCARSCRQHSRYQGGGYILLKKLYIIIPHLLEFVPIKDTEVLLKTRLRFFTI